MEFMRTYTASSSELTLLFSGVSFCRLEQGGKKGGSSWIAPNPFEVSAAQISGLANLVYLCQTGFVSASSKHMAIRPGFESLTKQHATHA